MNERRSMTGFLLAAVFALILSEFVMNTKVEATNVAWWSLGLYGCDLENVHPRNECRNCAAMHHYGLTSAAQDASCSEDSGPVRSIARGARYAILDCQRRFKASKWNCSTFQSKYIFGKFIEMNTPQTALLHSYFIAGATWSLATDCQREKLINCPCIKQGADRTTNENGDLVFYKCDANVDYARQYLDTFVLNNERDSGTLRGKLDWSNGNVGYNLAKKQEETCRCHGISGTCTSQTCHLKVRSVEEVGEELVEKYGDDSEKVAQPVTVDTTDRSSIQTLKYQEDSPDFCTKNDTLGILGVSGRPCDLNNPHRNCSTLCCDRGWNTFTEQEPVEECKFKWCCFVECKIVRYEYIFKTYCK